MTSFSDRLNALPRTHGGTRCGVGAWLETLSKEDQTGFNTALEDENITSSNLHRVMKEMAFAFGSSSVRLHRKHDCQCRSQTV